MKNILKEFKEFALKGDAFSLGIGVIIGAAFKGVIDSLINDIIMPPISSLTSKVNFADLYISLSRNHYESLKQAKDAGAIVITYGSFLNQLIIFLLTAIVLFIFIYKFQKMLTKKEKGEEKNTKQCKYCLNEIPNGAKRCGFCTSNV